MTGILETSVIQITPVTQLYFNFQVLKEEEDSDDLNSSKEEKSPNPNSDIWLRGASELQAHPHHQPGPPPLTCPPGHAGGLFPNGKFLGRFPFFGAEQQSDSQVSFLSTCKIY